MRARVCRRVWAAVVTTTGCPVLTRLLQGPHEPGASEAPRELHPLSPAPVTPQSALFPACPQARPTSHPWGQSGE